MTVFWHRKQVSAILGPVDTEIEAPANGTDPEDKLTFCGSQVIVSLHQGRNSRKGTIFALELRHMSEENLLADLRGGGATHIQRITTPRDGQRRDIRLLALTFDSSSLPEKINIGWLCKNTPSSLLIRTDVVSAIASARTVPLGVSRPGISSLERFRMRALSAPLLRCA